MEMWRHRDNERGGREEGRAKSRRFLLLTIYCLLFTLLLPANGYAQEPLPEVPEDADPAAGMVIYQSRCAVCHGMQGLGDGEMAAQAVNRPTAIGDPDYLATADPAQMFATIQNGNLTAGMPGFGVGNNSNPLSDEETWAVIAALYALPALNEPVETAVITGEVNNFTTGGAVTSGTALLQGFDPAFNEALTMETEITADGRYTFDLRNIPPQYIFRTVVAYEGLEFSSNFGQVSVLEPEIELEVGVFEQVTDSAVLRMSQVDTIVEFVAERVQVSQLYVVENVAPAVFVGESGNFRDGTIGVSLPAEAQNVMFLRGGVEATDFVPLNELMVQVNETDWQLILPIRSGAGAFRLLAQYDLPYDGGVTITHPVQYPTALATLILQDPTIDVVGDVWDASLGGIEMAEFARYQRPPLAIGENLQIVLSGSPVTYVDAQGNRVAFRDEQQELVIGAVALAAVVLMAAYFVYQWRTAAPAENERDMLLRTLAALDEAHEAGKIGKGNYRRERRRVKERLLSIWEGS